MVARFILIALFLSLVACDSSRLDECSSVPVGRCDSVQTCCNSADCYFVVDDQEFQCNDGKDCDAAAAEVEAHCSTTAR